MPTLSSAGWIVHDVGLATSIGGSMFGRLALEPALHELPDAQDRDQASEEAWRRFSWLNLAAHVAFAVPWVIGRSKLTGSEVSSRARVLTRTKDALVGASLITGIASIVMGRILGKRARQGEGPAQTGGESAKLERAVKIVGLGNLLSTAAIAVVTSLLAMEGATSFRFAERSRSLP